jgi:hypothetical protein
MPLKFVGPSVGRFEVTVWRSTEVRKPSRSVSFSAESATAIPLCQLPALKDSVSDEAPFSSTWPSPEIVTVTVSPATGARLSETT